MKQFALVLLGIASCGPSTAPPEDPVNRWVGPEKAILYSAALPDSCKSAVEQAANLWQDAGVQGIQMYEVPSDHLAVNGLTNPGQIGIRVDEPPKPLAAAFTYTYLVGKQIHHAEIFAGRACTSWHMAHELGHAFGLVDVNDPSNLMHFADAYKSTGLTENQKVWVLYGGRLHSL